MTCVDNEERLLLFAHRQLGLLDQLALLLHLRHCPTCQRTLQGFQTISNALVSASAIPGESGRRNTLRRGIRPTTGLYVLIVAALLGITLSGVFLGWHLVHPANALPASKAAPVGGCLPGLPNDSCR